jgi:hypothetical protein
MNGTFNIMISSKIISSVRLPGWALTLENCEAEAEQKTENDKTK